MSAFSVSRVVVTGGAQGIGASIARRLSSEGLVVSILDVNDVGAKETAERIAAETGGEVFGFGCDVTDREQVGEVFAAAAGAMGGLDTYVGNAGITRDGMFHKLSEDDWDRVISVNLTGVFNGLRAAAPWLRTPGVPGRVVLVSSVVAKAGNLGQMNYIAAKAGVVGLVRSGALELARFDTTVNGVRPGFIETPMTAAMPEAAQAVMTANPLGRAGQPGDIAGAVAFLCSDDASFVTGHLLDVNGGMAL
ncbi:SDR family oxidoreductase [Nakamurella deserti]|uniref:SDR family oxidoreductase n=1 Tax=Nakamurella deserti TaxID=2164074 RepID=UPI00130052C4|nr:SDR family NAD(P)-dependent oxidoreductase [Nakamurella deserti]